MNEKTIILKNGATLLFAQKDSYFTHVSYRFSVGSDDEKDATRGCAHLLEHMTFNGTSKHPRGTIEEIIESSGGDINACTDTTYTKYHGYVMSEDETVLFDILSEMCFAPLLKEEDFNTEKEVVLQELFDREDDVWNYAFDDYFYKCFGSFPTVGSEESIKNMTYVDFMEFYNKYYNFNNLIISVVSPSTDDVIVNILDTLLSKYSPVGEKNDNKYEITNSNTGVKTNSDGLEQSKLLIGFFVPERAIDYINIYNQIIGGGMTSRLFKNLREDKKLCYQVFSHTSDINGQMYLGIGISFNNIDKYDEVMLNCKKEIDGMTNITEAEFNRAKIILKSDLCGMEESGSKLAGSLIGRHRNDLPLSTKERIEQLNTTTIEDFNYFVNKYCINQKLYTYLLYDKN